PHLSSCFSWYVAGFVYVSLSVPLTVVSLPLFYFFFTAAATTEIYTLSLHDALPIFIGLKDRVKAGERFLATLTFEKAGSIDVEFTVQAMGAPGGGHGQDTQTEHNH